MAKQAYYIHDHIAIVMKDILLNGILAFSKLIVELLTIKAVVCEKAL